MYNIKPNYWVPCLGVAFIWYDPDSSLNAREERTLLVYHGLILSLIITLGLAICMGAAPV